MTNMNIASKIAKLQKLANNNSSEAEAMAALEKANELMAEYGIEEFQIINADENNYEDSIQTKNADGVMYAMYGIQKFTQIVMARSDNTKVLMFGPKEKIEIAKYLIDIIHRAIETEYKVFRNSDMGRTNIMLYGDNKTRKSFKMGMGMRINNRLIEMSQDQDIKVSKPGNALVQVSIQSRLMELWGIGVRQSKPSKKSVAPAYNNGKSAGNNVSLNQGIKGSRQTTKMLA